MTAADSAATTDPARPFDTARIALPPEDRSLSPLTGWTRDHWAAVADHLLLSLRPYFTSTRSRVQLPGIVSSHGTDSDGLEGFARSFLLYAFRTRGEAGVDPLGLTEWYRDGLVAGTDPAGPERWPLPSTVGQAKVEAASIALGLQLTRPWLWDTLDAAEQRNVVAWLADAPAGWYPDNNWLWFRITVETFLASVGGPHDPARIAADLATIESYYRADGWYADGSTRAFDYYCGWAMHLYPLLWTASAGADAFGARALEPVFRSRLTDFLDDHAALIGADGMPVLQGRSLIYRFAVAAPLWMGAITGATRVPMGTLRRGASGMLRAFLDRGAVDARGLLSVGLLGEWPAMAQSYSGSGSPYWAAKGFLGLALPADHEVWTAVEEPLPVERGDVRRVVRAAGWIVSGTAADGVVRVINHGTDHGHPGEHTADSPLYARLGYSSASLPPLVGATVTAPVDNTVGAVDAEGRSTNRSGFARGVIGDDGVAAFATSIARTHWVDGDDGGPDHGSGRTGRVTEGPTLVTGSLVRGAWEVRVIRRVADERKDSPVRLRVSGWPVSDATPAVARLVPLLGDATISTHTEPDTSPLGRTSVEWAEFHGVAVDDVIGVATAVGRAALPDAPALRVLHSVEGDPSAEVTWPDGAVSVLPLMA
ncbi:DUF2264 domain-containing protein [Leifsonia sp. LS1]|uniref:DUF2264 domain-containing protein n=1 Tax=Leifsonia sp. LS1 TaxID=2828483 RepID=UPI001CFE48D9|nr:DUF2264 domain-containing protein [Leifsonia sp. LS1]